MDFGAAEEISSDGGPQFKADTFKTFLRNWGVYHRKSSVDYAQSNGRAEVAVKSAKRIVYDNCNQNGSLNNDATVKAILQYRNTPLQDCGLSPAQIVMHRQLRDTIPCHPSKYELHPEWLIAAKEREASYHRKNTIIADERDRHSKVLKPLPLGTKVVIQGKNAKWDKQGQIVETLENRQYKIRLFGSGRITLRNRRFIRQCFHTSPNQSTLIADAITQTEETQGMTGGERTSVEGQTYQSQDPQHDLETPTETPIEPPISSPPARATETDTTPTLSRKMPLALRNLLPYNKPGKKGLAGEGRKVTFQFD